jgi:hypothetical protein
MLSGYTCGLYRLNDETEPLKRPHLFVFLFVCVFVCLFVINFGAVMTISKLS